MGAAISGAAACLGSCAASCACSALCKAATCRCLASPNVTNAIYVTLLLAATIAALAFRYTQLDLSVCVGACPDDNATTWAPVDSLSYTLCSDGKCQGQWAVFRISFALMALFVVLLVASSCKSKTSVYVHRGFWAGKLLLFSGVLVGTLFAPNDVFAYYAWVARFVAPFFLVYQLVSFIDFGYSLNTRLVDRDDQVPPARFLCWNNGAGTAYKRLLVGSSALLYVASLAGIACMYRFFPMEGCAFNPVGITFTLVPFLANSALSVSKVAPHGALFTSALVAAYTTWLCFSAMSSMPWVSCNPSAADEGIATSIVSIILAALTVAYYTFTVGRRDQRRKANDAAADDQVAVSVEESEDPLDNVEPESFAIYYTVMLLMSVYLAMLLSNWGEDQTSYAALDTDSGLPARYNTGLASAWVQMGTNFLCSAIYLWTLVAPFCCRHRDFGVDFD